MRTITTAPRRWALVYWVLGALLLLLKTPAVGQESLWYRVVKPGYPSGGRATYISSTGARRDAAGNVIYPFQFQDSASVEGVRLQAAPTQNRQDVAVCKFSSTGQLLWHWQPGGGSGGRRYPIDVITDSALNVYVYGRFIGSMTIGSTTLSMTTGGSCAFLAKFSPTGQVLWAQMLVTPLSSGASAFINGSNSAIDRFGNVLIAGDYDEQVRIGGQNVPASGSTVPRVFLAKVAPNGSLIWVKTGGGLNEMKNADVCVAPTGDIYFSAWFINFGAFDNVNVGFNNAYRQQSFLTKISPTGQILWTRQFSANSIPGGIVSRLKMHPSGDLLVRAMGDGTAFGVPLTPGVLQMMRVSPAGTARWIRPVPFDGTMPYEVDATGNIYFAYYYNSTNAPMPTLGNNVTLPPLPSGGTRGLVAVFDENLQAQWAVAPGFVPGGSMFGTLGVSTSGEIGVGGYYIGTGILISDTLPSTRPFTGSNSAAHGIVWSFRAPLTLGLAPEARRLVCPGAVLGLPFHAQANRFNATNSFRAELSDSTGLFLSPQVIGSLAGLGTGQDSITLTLPANLPPGRGYRVRIVSTSPAIVSAGAPLDLEVRTGLLARILAPDTLGVCPGQSLPLLRSQSPYGSQLQWTLNGQPLSGATGATYQPTQPGSYQLLTTGSVCGPATSNTVAVLNRNNPTVSLAPFAPVPVSTSLLALSGGSPAGGRWSGPGVTGAYFYPQTAGVGTHTITYTYTDRFGCAGSATQTLQVVPTTGLAETTEEPTLSLSPNPATGQTTLHLRAAQPTGGRVQLFDALGRLVQEQPLAAAREQSLPLALPSIGGLYRVRVLLPSAVVTRTLVVQP